MSAVVPRSDRRRSLVTLAVWSIGFVAVITVAAWQFGWLPVDEADHAPPADATAELTDGSAVPFDMDSAGQGEPWTDADEPATAQIDPAVFEQQSEPEVVPNPTNEMTYRDDRRGRLWNHVRDTPAPESPWPPEDSGSRYSNAVEPAGWLTGQRTADADRQPAPLPPGRSAPDAAAGPYYAGDETPHDPASHQYAPTTGQHAPAPERQFPDHASEHHGGVVPLDSHVRLVGVEEIDTAGPAAITAEGGPAGFDIDPAHPAARDLAEIDGLLAGGATEDIKEAHRRLSTMYWKQPDWRSILQKRIDQTAESIYFSNLRHYMEPYVIEPGDQLSRIAARYNVSWQYLERLNSVQATRIRPGQRLKVIKGPFAARVDLSDYELTIHAHGWYVRSYRIGIGRDGSTPVGKFTVQEKLVNPTYYRPPAEGGGIVAADDPQNPLGEYWVGIGNSYGIHGTIDPQSIGRAESRGCIRLLNDDVAEVYDFLVPGSEVVIQP